MKKYLIPSIVIIIIIAALFAFNRKTEVISPSSVTEIYQNTHFFSFQHASTTHIAESSTEKGDLVMVNAAQGIFQIYITAYDEDPPTLSVERIIKDIPELQIKDSKLITVTTGLEGLSFISENESGKETREIWFVNRGFLYQISALIESELFLEETIKTWKVID